MLPYFEVPPLTLGPLTIHPFGALVAAGVLIGARVMEWRAHWLQLDDKIVSSILGWAIVPGFVVAHLYSAIFYFPERIVASPIYLLQFWDGISSFGGFLGGTAGVILLLKRRQARFWPYADAIIFGFAFAWIFGRLGCTIAFDHPGRITSFVLAMPYPGSSVVLAGVRHNLGMYEAVWAIAISAYFYSQRRLPKPEGWYVTAFVAAYMPFRFALDFLRAEDARYLGMTAAQYAAIGLLAAVLWLRFRHIRSARVLVPVPSEVQQR